MAESWLNIVSCTAVTISVRRIHSFKVWSVEVNVSIVGGYLDDIALFDRKNMIIFIPRFEQLQDVQTSLFDSTRKGVSYESQP
jgi:hypothetical protein